MSVIDAFTLVTVVAYFILLVPKNCIKNLPLWLEKLIFIFMGITTLYALTLNNLILWYALGLLYTAGGVLSYIKVTNWGSIEQNMFMTVWDLLMAVICFVKTGL